VERRSLPLEEGVFREGDAICMKPGEAVTPFLIDIVYLKETFVKATRIYLPLEARRISGTKGRG